MDSIESVAADLRQAGLHEFAERVEGLRPSFDPKASTYYRPDPTRPSKKDWPAPGRFHRLMTRLFG